MKAMANAHKAHKAHTHKPHRKPHHKPHSTSQPFVGFGGPNAGGQAAAMSMDQMMAQRYLQMFQGATPAYSNPYVDTSAYANLMQSYQQLFTGFQSFLGGGLQANAGFASPW